MKNRESEDDKVSRKVWKAVKTEAGKVRMVKTKERRKNKEERKEEEKTKSGGCKENSRRMGNTG